MGGTFMRQHNFIFDVGAHKLGIARAKCNDDENWVESEEELRKGGNFEFGFREEDGEVIKKCTRRDVSETLIENQ